MVPFGSENLVRNRSHHSSPRRCGPSLGLYGLRSCSAHPGRCSNPRGSSPGTAVQEHGERVATPDALSDTQAIEQRLAALASLRDSGVISESEYKTKRIQILDSL